MTQTLVLETTYLAREGEWKDGEYDERSYLLGDPEQQALEDTIFEGIEWPELRGKVFRFCQREYGRCTGFVYVDQGPRSHPIGWVFTSIQPYEDVPERSYTREVWITITERVNGMLASFHFDAPSRLQGC